MKNAPTPQPLYYRIEILIFEFFPPGALSRRRPVYVKKHAYDMRELKARNAIYIYTYSDQPNTGVVYTMGAIHRNHFMTLIRNSKKSKE